MTVQYTPIQPDLAQIAGLAGAAVLDFGTNWCGHCRASQPLVDQALASHPGVQHIKVEDGAGRPLGRAYGVRLWPTLVFLRDGQELARLVRPLDAAAVAGALALVQPAAH